MARSPAKPPANATGRAFLMLYLHNSSVHGRQDRRQTSRQDVVELNRELSRDRIPKISNGKTSTGYKFIRPAPRRCGQPTTYMLQENGRAFLPNYLHESWRDYLYWDTELDPN